MLDTLYSNALLEAVGNMPAARRLPAPDASSTKHSRVCGSQIHVDLCVDGNEISDIAILAKACALGQATASIVARHAVGIKATEMRRVAEEMHQMLKAKGNVPAGAHWQELTALEPVRAYPTRHASTLLVFKAVTDCLNQLDL